MIEQAALAAGRHLGLRIRVLQQPRTTQAPVWRPDAVVEVLADGRAHRFVVEAKAVDRIETLGYAKTQLRQVLQHGFPGHRPLLIAPYLTRTLAGHCRKLKLPFLDTVGNAYLEAPGLLVYATGEPRVGEVRTPGYRAATAAGVRVVFALLCRPELTERNYRELARYAGVALGTVGGVLDDLRARGFLQGKCTPRLRNARRLVDEWITHYAATLRPKLHPRRFACDPAALLATDLKAVDAFWGGEVAGQRLTGYLQPERFLIYLAGPLNPLLARGRMRLADPGNVEILDAFWPDAHGFGPEPLKHRTVPPLLVYADLMITGEGRNLETATLIYDKFLAPALGA